MADYKDAQDVVPHKFYKSPLVISNGDYNINVNGLNSVTATPAADNVIMGKVADGLKQHSIDPDEGITVEFETAEAADTCTELYDLLVSGEVFKLSYTDPNSPNFNVSGKNCLFLTRPTITRNNEMPLLTWTVIVPYGQMRGGAFTRSL